MIIYTVFVLLFYSQSVSAQSGHYRNGKTLFTETISGTCDDTTFDGYTYNYDELGGAELDEVTQLGMAFWMRWRPSSPGVSGWDKNAKEKTVQVFYLSDNDTDSFTYRILSFGM
jgi:hypothetical protein